MKFPINYDFGKNWDTHIKPLLELPSVKSALTKGVNGYLSNWPNGEKYKKNTCPANYSSRDGYDQLMMRKEEEILEKMEKDGTLPERYIELKNTDLEEDDDLMDEYFELQQEIVRPYFEWDAIKYDLETYYLSGSCHWYAPTFEITLARLVEPNEKWMVQTGEKHTTVINKEKTKLFDLLYWCDGDRLENHIFGDQIKKKDKTLGGKAAYIDSLPN